MSDAIAASILGGIALTIITTFGGAWMLSGRVSRVEEKVGSLDSKLDITIKSAVLEHQIKCPANTTTSPRGIAAMER